MAKKRYVTAKYMPRYLIIDFVNLYSYKTAKLPDLTKIPLHVKLYDVRDALEYDTAQCEWFSIVDFEGFD